MILGYVLCFVIKEKNSYFHIYICNKAILILHLFKYKIVLIFRTGNVDNVLKSCNRDWYHRLSVDRPFLCLSVYELSSILGINYKTACHTSRMNNWFILICIYILVIISLLLGEIYCSCPVRPSVRPFVHHNKLIRTTPSFKKRIPQSLSPYCQDSHIVTAFWSADVIAFFI